MSDTIIHECAVCRVTISDAKNTFYAYRRDLGCNDWFYAGHINSNSGRPVWVYSPTAPRQPEFEEAVFAAITKHLVVQRLVGKQPNDK